MQTFIENRDKDMDVLEPYLFVLDVEDWPQYSEFEDALEQCRKFCTKNIHKNATIMLSKSISRPFYK